jgi:hypothetical protein
MSMIQSLLQPCSKAKPVLEFTECGDHRLAWLLRQMVSDFHRYVSCFFSYLGNTESSNRMLTITYRMQLWMFETTKSSIR